MSFHSKPHRFDPPQHPLLRIVLDEGAAAQRYKDFLALLRGSLRSGATRSTRIHLARQVIEKIDALKLGFENANAFRLEWLRLVTADLPDPVLLQHLALAELTDSELDLHPFGWCDAEPTGTDLPHLGRLKTGQVFAEEQRPAVNAWQATLKLAMSAMEDETLQQWSDAECLAALRAIILTTTATHATHAREARTHQAFLEGIGAALWDRLALQLNASRPELQEPIWSDKMKAKLRLHMEGLLSYPTNVPVAEAKLAAPRPLASAAQEHLVVVTEPIPPSTEKCDKESLKQYEALREPLPLAPMPVRAQLEEYFRRLKSEFPWATDAISSLENIVWPSCLVGAKSLRIRPVLLVGKPGAGKSRFARRVAEVFGLPYMAVGCGGSGDSKILSGTARGWASGEPMPVISMLLRRQTASAFVLLDEVDKVVSNTINSPPLQSILLGLLEPETARRWRDGFLQAACDLGGVTFWATANSLQSISRPLLSRFEVVLLPEPGPEHVPSLIESITSELEREWSLPIATLPRLAAPPEGPISVRELRAALQRELARFVRETLRPDRLH